MKPKRWTSRAIIFAIACGILSSSWVMPAQETITVHAVVTATTRFNEGIFTVPQKSIIVDLGRKPQGVFSWMPLRGTRAGLQLALLIDNSPSSGLSTQLNDIGKFIEALPATTQIAVGYMQNGRANIAQSFTSNHESAASAVRAQISMTGAITRYRCLSDLVQRWPGGNQDLRHEVIMITDGVDPYSGWSSYCADNPNVQATTISDAQKSNVVVYSIIFNRAGLMDLRSLAEKAGQNYLVQVSNATGGKAYSLRLGYPVTLAAFLFDILCKLDNQYELSFVTATRNTLRPLEVKTTEANTRLRAPEHIWIRYRGK